MRFPAPPLVNEVKKLAPFEITPEKVPVAPAPFTLRTTVFTEMLPVPLTPPAEPMPFDSTTREEPTPVDTIAAFSSTFPAALRIRLLPLLHVTLSATVRSPDCAPEVPVVTLTLAKSKADCRVVTDRIELSEFALKPFIPLLVKLEI